MIDKAIADILARRRSQERTWAKSAEIGNNPSTSCTILGAPSQALTNRCSQPPAEKEITKVKLESRKLERKLAPASGG
jgi:hypothetical protein